MFKQKPRLDKKQDPFGVWEIRFEIGKNPELTICEQARFNNLDYACRYVYALQHNERYENYGIKIVYNPPDEEFINNTRNSIFAPNKQIKRDERNST